MRVFYSCNGSGSELRRRFFGRGYTVRPMSLVNGTWKYTGRSARFKTERDAVSHAVSLI